MDIDGHPPFPTSSKQLSDIFGNLLFLAGFYFRSRFKALNDVFWGKWGDIWKFLRYFLQNESPRRYLSN
jgi:hypothetical protein